jgi:hypothetical protein
MALIGFGATLGSPLQDGAANIAAARSSPKRISNSPGPSELGTMTASAAEMERIDIFLITSECANGQKSKPTILARVSPDASRMQRT